MDNFYSHICSKINDIFSFNGENLCHYTSPIALNEILKNKALRFTDYRFLNDTTEGTYIYDVIASLDLSVYDEGFKKAIENLKNRRFTVSEIVNYRLSDISHSEKYYLGTEYRYFLCSFSVDDNNLAMWNYYTKTPNGMGYNIVLYTIDLEKNFAKSLSESSTVSELSFKKVIYDRNHQKDIVKFILDYYYEELKKTNNEEKVENSLYKTIDEVKLYIKNPCFAIENEVRAIVKMSSVEYEKMLSPDGMINVVEKNGYFVPYFDLCFGDTEDLASVTISPKGENPFFNQSLRILLNKYGYRFSKITNSKIPLR